ncbi:MAG: hypothetical protein LBJ99_04780 [Oscillospiraceae bacterium]|nr:hypothetical protein [Oscillospiraceae bacterium]
MKLSERVAYLRGLADGLELEAGSKEVKLMMAIIDVLEAAADEVLGVKAETAGISDKVSVLSDEMEEFEELIFSIGDSDMDDFDDDDFDDDDDDDVWCDCDDDDDQLSVECSCGAVIEIGDAELFEGETVCPKCGEKLTFDLGDPDEELEI